MVNPAARALLDFRRVNPVTFSWPVVLLGAAVVLVIGLLVAWGVLVLDRRDRAESRGEGIQQAVGAALARDAALAEASILPVATVPRRDVPRSSSPARCLRRPRATVRCASRSASCGGRGPACRSSTAWPSFHHSAPEGTFARARLRGKW
jgi:hypothetical protein